MNTRNNFQTIVELRDELEALVSQGYGKEHFKLQIGENEHDELELVRVRVFKFAGKARLYLVF